MEPSHPEQHTHLHDHQHQHPHSHNEPVHHVQKTSKNEAEANKSPFRLAVSATLHCLLGCGIGEVIGMIISTAAGFSNSFSIIFSILLGFIAGMILGMIPLRKHGFTWTNALRTVIVGEGLSIAVMETFEVLAAVLIPGVMHAHLDQPVFWIGMIAGLAAGFIAALPVNIVMIRRGVRHLH
jgi:F0F1-type ATP synthase assembly protein I